MEGAKKFHLRPKVEQYDDGVQLVILRTARQAGTLPVDALVGSASADDYDALLLTGGTVNPDKSRLDSGAVGFVKAFVESGNRSPRSATARGHCWRPAS